MNVVAGYVLTLVGYILGGLSLSIIGGVAGYVLGGGPGVFWGVGSILLVLSVASLGVAARLKRGRPVQHDATAQPARAMDSSAEPSASDQDPATEPCRDAAPSLGSSLLPLASIALVAVTTLGPRRAMRVGIRLYSLWSATRAILARDDVNRAA